MTPYYDHAGIQIFNGDCLSVLRTWPDAFVQCIVTSPPYWGLRDYGVDGQLGLEKSPEEYTAKMVEVFRECRRVLKADGILWLNLGDSYATPKAGNTNGTGAGGISTGKVQQKGGVLDQVFTKELPSGLKPKDLVGIPWRIAFALQADGWYLRSDIIWHKPNPMPESVTDRPTKSHEYVFLMSKSAKYYYDADAIAEPLAVAEHCPGNRKLDDSRNESDDDLSRSWSTNGKRNKRSVWTVPTSPFPEAHFATFPPDLIKPMVMAGSRPGDIILDPFMGAGTVALVAKELNRQYLGIELNADYIRMAERRLRQEVLAL